MRSFSVSVNINESYIFLPSCSNEIFKHFTSLFLVLFLNRQVHIKQRFFFPPIHTGSQHQHEHEPPARQAVHNSSRTRINIANTCTLNMSLSLLMSYRISTVVPWGQHQVYIDALIQIFSPWDWVHPRANCSEVQTYTWG